MGNFNKKQTPTPVKVEPVEKVTVVTGTLSDLYMKTSINPQHKAESETACNKVLVGLAKYQAVEAKTSIPWYVIACIHSLESGCDFKAVLHNGERIIGTGKKTTLVPAGRGPFATWEEAAIDALTKYKAPVGLEATLDFLERYNGTGYRKKGINSPYLWSKTSAYTKGKYVADGRYDSEAVSSQVGCVALLKIMESKGLISFSDTKVEPVTPVTTDHNLAILKEAAKYVGVREKGGANRGPDVEMFQKAVDGKAQGEPWCMSFMMFCLKNVENSTKINTSIVETEHCQTTYNKSTKNQVTKPKPGDWIVWRHGTTASGHVGIIESIEYDTNGNIKAYKTIEGNTSDASMREGDGVYRRNRSPSGEGSMKIMGFLRCYP